MARVTVEDCVLKVPNRFELVLLAAQRSRDISAGSQLTVERDNDKNPVVALREIADATVSLDVLKNSIVKGLQKVAEADEPEEEITDFLAGEQEVLRQDVASEIDADDGMHVEDEDGEEADEPIVVEDGFGDEEA